MNDLFPGVMGSFDQPNGVDEIGEPFYGNGNPAYGNPNPSANTTEPTGAQSSEPQPTLSQYLNDHPDASYEDAMKYMSQHSEEWAEKYLDYLTEKGELDRANAYTAEREDTAYQRLVQDLQKAGFNPAMMYAHNANISASGSQGYIKMAEGANSRAVGNYSKLQKILLGYMLYGLGVSKTVISGITGIAGAVLGGLG